MNAAYAYDTREASSIITNRIYYLLESHHWSVKTLSDESNIPYETLKKLLSRKTENTSFHNIMKIALAFKCNLNYLVEPLETSNPPTLANTPKEIKDELKTVKKAACIPLFYPSSLSCTQVPKSTSLLDTLDISSYAPQICTEVEFGIVVSSYCYHPVYSQNDVLLISRKRPPRLGEIGVFLHSGNVFIRTFYPGLDSFILRSVNDIGPDIQIYDFSTWTVIGYVVGVHKLAKRPPFN